MHAQLTNGTKHIWCLGLHFLYYVDASSKVCAETESWQGLVWVFAGHMMCNKYHFLNDWLILAHLSISRSKVSFCDCSLSDIGCVFSVIFVFKQSLLLSHWTSLEFQTQFQNNVLQMFVINPVPKLRKRFHSPEQFVPQS